jgi:hypothetical protein
VENTHRHEVLLLLAAVVSQKLRGILCVSIGKLAACNAGFPLGRLFNPEDEGDNFLRNIG